MQIWNSEELLLVLDIIVLSLENHFKRLQMIIVLMKQNSIATTHGKKKAAVETYRDGGVCFSVCSLALFLEVQALLAVLKSLGIFLCCLAICIPLLFC